MTEVCPICKGKRHLLIEKEGKKRLVRCECYIREIIEHKLNKFSLSPSFVYPYVSLEGIKLPKDKNAQLVSSIYEKYKSGSAIKQIFLNSYLSINETKRIMSLLCAMIPQEDFQIKDLSDIIDDQFKNSRFSLKKVNIITLYFTTTKNLKEKLIKDIKFRASMENKIVIFVTEDLSALKSENPELVNFISKAVVAPYI